MNFGAQIKKIRTERKLTQDEMAEMLLVSRQAVSNWENDRNLPDIEMLITMARTFDISLDQLILGGKDMNNMTQKLITDGSENRRAKMNMVSLCIGTAMILIGIACLAIKAASVEYVDESGMLHENFFLLPMGFFFLFCGFVAFLVVGIKNTVYVLQIKNGEGRNRTINIIVICLSVCTIFAGGLMLLITANSGIGSFLVGIIVSCIGFVGFLVVLARAVFI